MFLATRLLGRRQGVWGRPPRLREVRRLDQRRVRDGHRGGSRPSARCYRAVQKAHGGKPAKHPLEQRQPPQARLDLAPSAHVPRGSSQVRRADRPHDPETGVGTFFDERLPEVAQGKGRHDGRAPDLRHRKLDSARRDSPEVAGQGWLPTRRRARGGLSDDGRLHRHDPRCVLHPADLARGPLSQSPRARRRAHRARPGPTRRQRAGTHVGAVESAIRSEAPNGPTRDLGPAVDTDQDRQIRLRQSIGSPRNLRPGSRRRARVRSKLCSRRPGL